MCAGARASANNVHKAGPEYIHHQVCYSNILCLILTHVSDRPTTLICDLLVSTTIYLHEHCCIVTELYAAVS